MERSTKQRAAILTAIQNAGRPLVALEILLAARQEVEGLGLATVYRNLKLLLESGSIITVHLPGDSPRYEAANQSHHHHFQCEACLKVFDIHHCPGDLQPLAPAGFKVERHELTLYGRCANC